MSKANIASHLPLMASAQPDTLAVAVQGSGTEYPRYTYKELDDISDIIANGLQEHGIVKGTRTVLMVTPGLEFFALVFALFKIGAVLVAIDPGMGVKNLGSCLEEAEPEAFIGVRRAHLGRIMFGWARKTLRKNIVVEAQTLMGLFMTSFAQVEKRGRESNQAAMNPVEENDAAAILFTSGSTGIPKGVNYTHGNFSAQVETLKTLYNIEPGEVDVATFPLFALFAPAMGMTSIIPDMDFTRPGSVDPEKIQRAIQDFKATTMFGSPALINRVGRWGADKGVTFPSLKRVLCAGAPVPRAVIERFSHLLADEAELYTPYGATESLPVSSIGSKQVLNETGAKTSEGHGVCVGQIVKGLEAKIIKISDDAIPVIEESMLQASNEIGEIIVRGAQVTASYYNKQQATDLAKIADGAGSFYHRMGDLGYFDDKGRLWFCGRKSERIELEDISLFTICCEGVFNTHERVFRSALIGLQQEGKNKAAICIELEADSQYSKQSVIIQELKDIGARYPHTAMIQDFFIHPGFPVDIRHNAKIGRRQLAEWAAEQS